MHVAYPDVGLGVPVSGDRDKPVGGVDARTRGPPRTSEFDGQPRATRDVNEPVALADAEPVMHGDVLAAVARLAESGEVDRLPAPTLVDHVPLDRHVVGLAVPESESNWDRAGLSMCAPSNRAEANAV